MDWKKIILILLILLIIGSFIYLYINKCDYDNPSKKYVAKSITQCAVIRYVCESNEKYFQDKCGCGCESI